MGLKIKNYKSVKFGIELPEAYAVIDRVLVKGDVIDASLKVQTSRDNAVNAELAGYDEYPICCKWDRKKSIAEAVYEAAKEQGFEDWEADIV